MTRESLLRRGLLLAIGTLAWNVVEGVVAVAAGALSSSVALIGFGIDSFVETASAGVVGWRLWVELRGRDLEATEQLERRTSRIAGALLLLLALYIVIDAGRRLVGFGAQAEESPVGMALVAVSLTLMPVLGWGKLRVSKALGSGALRADAYETIACAWLSLTTLVGLMLNATFGWWWADPLAALALVPLIVREGIEGWKGAHCEREGEGEVEPARPEHGC
jgi:cation diffusion facilitator family transporter